MSQLKRRRWAVRATLLLGVAASITGNILHALDNPISQTIAAWPPLALLFTVELISRVPVHRRSLATARLLATATIAGIAAWVSYWHMAGVAARYGETGASPYLLPLSVDGLVVVASICLVELSGRIRAAEEGESVGQAGETRAPADHGGAEGAGSAGSVGAAQGGPAGDGGAAPGGESRTPEVAAPAAQIELPRPAARKAHTKNPQLIARAHKQTPDASHKEIAARLKLSPATVKRYRPPVVSEGAPPKVNGHVPELAHAGHSSNDKES